MGNAHFVSDVGELVPTRLSLIERLRDLDDHSSWQEFFDTYWKLIYCAAVKGGLSDAEAEDVVQETIIGIARNMENFRYEPEICSFKGWLMRVTRCRIIDHLRKARAPKHSFIPIPSDTKTGGRRGISFRFRSRSGFEDLGMRNGRKPGQRRRGASEAQTGPGALPDFYLYSVKGMPARDLGKLLGASVATSMSSGIGLPDSLSARSGR